MLAVAGWLLASAPGCAAELVQPSNEGGHPGSSQARRELSGNVASGETSEWEVIRAASEPGWTREADLHKPTEPEQKTPEGSEQKKYRSSDEEEGPTRTPVGSPDNALVAVDREHGLPRGYAPEDLVPLSKQGVPTLAGRKMLLRDEAAGALSELVADARADDVELVVGSAYRSYELQVASYEKWSVIHGEGAGGFSAPPGHSEHQLGTAVDFTNANARYELGQWFGDTRASRWLRENAARYGFVLSYPDGSQEQTGYRWEPWHYRYIGKENAGRYRSGEYSAPIQFFLREGVRPPEKESSPVPPGYRAQEASREEAGIQGGG